MSEKLRALDLFSGIGGFSLGLERTGGFETVAFCEIDPFCRAVLAKHWPDVPCHDDITTREFTKGEADVICGGFPCQDISFAGSGAGLAGKRSGLWRELLRAIRLVRPKFAVVENVAALLGRGLDVVLWDLASIGYDTEWHCIPASAVGAPHRRDRIWIIAHARSEQHKGYRTPISGEITSQLSASNANTNVYARELDARTNLSTSSRGEGSHLEEGQASHWERLWFEPGSSNPELADTESERRGEARQHCERQAEWIAGGSEILADTICNGLQGLPFIGSSGAQSNGEQARREIAGVPNEGFWVGSWWSTEPDVGRVAHGIPARVDRLRSLGNAVVPQIPEIIGRAILQAQEQMRKAA